MSLIPEPTQRFVVDTVVMLGMCTCRELPGVLHMDGNGHPYASTWAHEITCPAAIDARLTTGEDDR
ncbi:hypothetical protein [Cellulomonas xylanilytica]|uniref:Uncharacterized protein n=1 Tax=Cellulomonas xylanilytica TaxID=233583 RepID=A0A510V2G9_9CELL|nr:hypothetical protein [Cellulomonas xylanilytica]GEK20996.1 hypothetical protein CXY01_15160 [Cellulomonas xylanilytica]